MAQADTSQVTHPDLSIPPFVAHLNVVGLYGRFRTSGESLSEGRHHGQGLPFRLPDDEPSPLSMPLV